MATCPHTKKPKKANKRTVRLGAEVTLIGLRESGGNYYAHLEVGLPGTVYDDHTGGRIQHTHNHNLVAPVSKRDYDILREKYEEAKREVGDEIRARAQVRVSLKYGGLVFKL